MPPTKQHFRFNPDTDNFSYRVRIGLTEYPVELFLEERFGGSPVPSPRMTVRLGALNLTLEAGSDAVRLHGVSFDRHPVSLYFVRIDGRSAGLDLEIFDKAKA